jgi:hypothetical protein
MLLPVAELRASCLVACLVALPEVGVARLLQDLRRGMRRRRLGEGGLAGVGAGNVLALCDEGSDTLLGEASRRA